MNDLENRRHQMFIGVYGFGTVHSADFLPNSMGGQLFTELGQIIVYLDEHALAPVSGFGWAQQATASRAAARQALIDDLRAISRTAEAIATDDPGIEEQFPMPPAGSDPDLLSAARSFVANATPLSIQFINHELPADFLADLASDIADFESAISQHATSIGTQESAGVSIDEAIAEGLNIVKKLDAIVRNKYANDPATLAQWTSASHTERSPRHKQSA